MVQSPIYVGDSRLHELQDEVGGRLVELDGEAFYEVSNFDCLRPFFMSITSSSDHWMFLSSSGGLTAGRKNAARALFPYYTDDKIHESCESTGSKTIVLMESNERRQLWEPFSSRYRGVYRRRQNLYKSVLGNRVRFEEKNLDLGLTFEYEWTNSERFGLVRRSRLENENDHPISLRILDGIQNLLPHGVDRKMQESFSTLVDAYKKAELIPDTGLGLFLLSSIPVDRAEPSESLKATTVWSVGLEPEAHLLSNLQLDDFRAGRAVLNEADVRAERGAYFLSADLILDTGAEEEWYTVAELNQGPSDVDQLSMQLRDKGQLLGELKKDVDEGSRKLSQIVAASDGWQCSEDALTCARHVSNTLFNVMRGGVFADGYNVERSDLHDFAESWNGTVTDRTKDFWLSLPEVVNMTDLIERAREYGDPQVRRLCYEYLPLTFSRRHGDPSRPWNEFAIETRNEDGSQSLHFEGNWRDIFQNWEALAISYPAYLVGMVSKFLNASTPDGYNPYRISRDGIDWEVSDPEDPWSYIGYWGDHQLVYLLKLLELTRAHYPDALVGLLDDRIFSYANVPYRIKPYEQLLANPHDTIEFDGQAHQVVLDRVVEIGSDGRLIWDPDGNVCLVNLTEKLLVSILAKLANLIPEAGIWMNTQRPEWNDANNALVGNGASVVTLCYLRRYLHFLQDLFESVTDEIDLSIEVAEWMKSVTRHLARFGASLDGPMTDQDRKRILDVLGAEASDYRAKAYSNRFGGSTVAISADEIRSLLRHAGTFVDHSLMSNRREDGLFHAYNIVSVAEDDSISIRRLHEMLEGQVAILSSGLLSSEETLSLLVALRASDMYREDQHSYMLYPDRGLPRFVEKNIIPPERVADSPLIQGMLEDGNRIIVERDSSGGVHFNGRFRNKYELGSALERMIGGPYSSDVEKERGRLCNLFEEMFNHREYTGRSGTFFGYEGLGSIYWHMVSKLLVAVGESFHRASDEEEDDRILKELADWYYDIRTGIGVEKNPAEYGAIPTDPYSHTPGTTGAQQPGMTGQVKEDILARWFELGVNVSTGCIEFKPALLRESDFLSSPQTLFSVDVSGQPVEIELTADSLGFTYCQVPVIYRKSDRDVVTLTYADGSSEELGTRIGTRRSAEIFGRTGSVERIEVEIHFK